MDNAAENNAICANGDAPSDQATRRSKRRKFSSVRIRVLIPLTVALFVVLGGFVWTSYADQKRKQDEKCEILRNAVSRGFQAELGLEERMMELKREVNELARKTGVAPPYDSPVLGSVK